VRRSKKGSFKGIVKSSSNDISGKKRYEKQPELGPEQLAQNKEEEGGKIGDTEKKKAGHEYRKKGPAGTSVFTNENLASSLPAQLGT